MVRIRLRRVGLKKQPSYRIVVTDQRSPRDGRFIEIIGHYNPRTQPITDIVDEGRALHWLSNGAQPTDAVKRILNRTGTLGRFERLRQGEEVEALIAEAEEILAKAEPVSPKTRFPSPGPGESKQKAAALAAAAASAEVVAEAEAVAEAVEEVEAEESEPETETVAEVETAEDDAAEETKEEAAEAESESAEEEAED